MDVLSRPAAAIAYEHVPDLTTLVKLSHPWNTEPTTVDGKPIPIERIEQDLRRRMERGRAAQVSLVPPGEGPAENPSLPRPIISLTFAKVSEVEVGGDGGERAGAFVELTALQGGHYSYAWMGVITHPFASHLKENSERFLDALQRTVAILKPPFAFADATEAFFDPGLQDARTKAWGATYYGPDLVKAIGREIISTSPAHRVAWEGDGGCWLFLDPLPLAASPAKESRRAAVQAHLRLKEVFADGVP